MLARHFGLFYSRLRQCAEDEDQLVDVYEAYTEHDVADHLIQFLKSSRKPDEKFKAEMQVLGESVKHHVKEEESTVFSIARKLIDQNERNTGLVACSGPRVTWYNTLSVSSLT